MAHNVLFQFVSTDQHLKIRFHVKQQIVFHLLKIQKFCQYWVRIFPRDIDHLAPYMRHALSKSPASTWPNSFTRITHQAAVNIWVCDACTRSDSVLWCLVIESNPLPVCLSSLTPFVLYTGLCLGLCMLLFYDLSCRLFCLAQLLRTGATFSSLQQTLLALIRGLGMQRRVRQSSHPEKSHSLALFFANSFKHLAPW